MYHKFNIDLLKILFLWSATINDTEKTMYNIVLLFENIGISLKKKFKILSNDNTQVIQMK